MEIVNLGEGRDQTCGDEAPRTWAMIPLVQKIQFEGILLTTVKYSSSELLTLAIHILNRVMLVLNEALRDKRNSDRVNVKSHVKMLSLFFF